MNLYDESKPSSIEEYAKKAVGKSFIELLDDEKNYDYFNSLLNTGKGSLGNFVEKYFFKYEINSSQQPDFPKAGVELKVAPYIINKNGTISAKERLIITLINYLEVIQETFENSHLYGKIKKILLMEYLFEKNKNKADFKIKYAGLFEIPYNDLLIIKQDFEYIINKIKQGLAHELSEADTLYLGAAPKGKDSSSLREQPYSPIKALQRAFCLKQSYMTYILRNYIFKQENPSLDENILKTNQLDVPFEEYIKNKILQYKGKTTKELSQMFNIRCNDNKNFVSYLCFKILGIKNNKASEFEKANIAIKTIRLENNNTIEQSMSFKNFKFTEVVKENVWEESELYELWGKTKYLFIIFKTNDDKKDKNKEYFLYDCQLWNMPAADLNNYAKKMWTELKKTINDGIKTYKEGNRVFNNLPKKKDNKVCHIRPKGADSSCKYSLPNGGEFTKQCYWLNNDYILNQLNCINCAKN